AVSNGGGGQGPFEPVRPAVDPPSKPHPAMIVQAMAEVGADASTTIMVGDTSYDMEMAVNAGVRGIGVGWGYHAPARLLQAGARLIIDEAADLMAVIDQPVRAIA